MQQPAIAVMGSHSALDVCRGAKAQGFRTIVIGQKGRSAPYTKHYAAQGGLGCVDETIELDAFKDIARDDVQQRLVDARAVFVPHRSFEVYLGDYDMIEKGLRFPIFGNKHLLRMEERDASPNQYDVLRAGGIRYPKPFASYKDIDRLVIVKVLEEARGFERAFFLVSSPAEFESVSEQMLAAGTITHEALEKAVIEEFVVGVQVNLNFFYDPLAERLELLGTDTRRQTNLDGVLRIPAREQAAALEKLHVQYEEAGHIAVTVLESMLEAAFEAGERFVTAARTFHPKGVVGPFGLQSMIIPGPPKKEFVVFDVSPRMPGSPGIVATPYGQYLHGRPISAGERVAMLVKDAVNTGKIDLVTS
jgi:5-formaminoimidazole-4-carboxamide-1-(beta)-D-ribofuranosyl 5'-monophosphate synthetase